MLHSNIMVEVVMRFVIEHFMMVRMWDQLMVRLQVSDLVMDFIVRFMVHHWLMIAAVMVVMVDLVNLERSRMVIQKNLARLVKVGVWSMRSLIR